MKDSVRDDGVGIAAPRYPSKKFFRVILYAVLAAFDAAAIGGGFAIASYGLFGTPFETNSLALLAVVLAITLGVGFNSRAYSLDSLESARFSVGRGLIALGFAAVATLVAGFVLRPGNEPSRLVLAIGIGIAAILLMSGRILFDQILQRAGWSPLREITIVDGEDAIQADDPIPAALIAEDHGLVPDAGDPIMLDRLGRCLDKADRVFVACTPEKRHDWSLILKGANIDGFLLMPELDALGVIGTGRHLGITSVRVAAGPLDLRSRMVKRVFDLVGALVLLILLAPLLIAVAVAIKLDTPGPIFFLQERLGRGNRLFRIYKFRSMRDAASDRSGERSASRDDDRVTRVGRLIRSTSMDELPQLLNVLKGEMSFVGPRPHALGSTAGDALFWDVDRRYWHRHATKPGITGLAQVRGHRGATLERTDLERRLQSDLDYLANWAIWRDIWILLMTLKVIKHRNAY